jgi:Na+-driven multidrug efflux pump
MPYSVRFYFGGKNEKNPCFVVNRGTDFIQPDPIHAAHSRRAVFRGHGDSRTPLITVAIACVFNIAGDLLLVAVFHLGAAGAADYLKAYGIDCLLTCFLFCFIGFFDGMARTRFVMIQGVASAFGVRVPVSYLMSELQPVSLFHIGLAVPISTLFQMMLVLIYYAWLKRQIRQNPEAFL